MKLKEFSKATGASERQIDYWCRAGIALADPQEFPGSGVWRNYPEENVKKVRLLILVSTKMGRYFSVDTLKQIFDNYHLGYLPLGDGLFINWRVDDDRITASPERGSTISG